MLVGNLGIVCCGSALRPVCFAKTKRPSIDKYSFNFPTVELVNAKYFTTKNFGQNPFSPTVLGIVFENYNCPCDAVIIIRYLHMYMPYF